jgi:hypothetical protein
MVSASLALALSAAGFRATLTGNTIRSAYAPFLFHVCFVTSLTLGLTAAGSVDASVVPWLMGVWFTGLAAVYAGHAFAVRNWGSPMSRAILLFGLRRIHIFARSSPPLSMAAGASLAVAFTVGWWAGRLDMPGPGEPLRLVAPMTGACVLLACAGVLSRVTRFPVCQDILLGVVLGGHGPQAEPPPEDPTFGRRWPAKVMTAPSRRPTVVLFVVDSLRPRNMSAYGYERATTPFLFSLIAEHGARAVPLALSNCASSEVAAWSLLSSRRARHVAVNAPCLHDLLHAAGFSVQFFLSGAHRNWMGLEYLYGSRHDTFVDLLIDKKIASQVRHLRAKPSSAGTFFMFHLMSVHAASGSEPPLSWKPARNRFTYSETDALDEVAQEQIRNHYDSSVLYADTCLAHIVEALGRKGFLDDALVVMTSDHGEAIGERLPVMIGHGRGLYQETIHVPLIVWDTTRTLSQPVFLADHTDVAPTILDALGMEAPAAWQGSSVFEHPGRRNVHIEHISHRVGRASTHMEALVAQLPLGLFKHVRHRQAGNEILRQSFCLSTDPGETDDLSTRLDPQVEAELDRCLQNYHAEPAIALHTTWSYLGEAI